MKIEEITAIPVAVRVPAQTRPMRALFNHLADDLIVETDFAMPGGAVSVSGLPGLGVALDLAAVGKHRIGTKSGPA